MAKKINDLCDFCEVVKDPLLDINHKKSNNTELWLIHWPLNQGPDFDGKEEVSLNLHPNDGFLAQLQDSSGKAYDMVNFTSHDPNAATVFLSSAAEPEIVGKISRRVSLIHYPEPSELQKQRAVDQKHKEQRSGTSSTAPTQSSRGLSSKSTTTHSSRHKSSLSGEPKPMKRRHEGEQTRSTNPSTQDSGRVRSGVNSSGSFEHSKKKKA